LTEAWRDIEEKRMITDKVLGKLDGNETQCTAGDLAGRKPLARLVRSPIQE